MDGMVVLSNNGLDTTGRSGGSGEAGWSRNSTLGEGLLLAEAQP